MVIENDLANVALAEFAPPTCRHHWIIEPANGRISWGECRNCNEVRQFENSITDMDREVDEN